MYVYIFLLKLHLQSFKPSGEGFDFHIHAIGDKAVRQALNAVESTKQSGTSARHRLTHVELVNKNDLPRFKQLGVIADVQVMRSLSIIIYISTMSRLLVIWWVCNAWPS
jgi:predicted amidohydrolase YtcJ